MVIRILFDNNSQRGTIYYTLYFRKFAVAIPRETAMFKQLLLSRSSTATIEWEMTPDLAFCTFSAKGLRDDLNQNDERICYFFIDNYGELPKLYLMERGTRFVNILAEIMAPLEMLETSITDHGSTLANKDNFPINSALKEWLLREVVECKKSKYLIPTLDEEQEKEDFGEPLPSLKELQDKTAADTLPSDQTNLTEDQLQQCIIQHNFFDKIINPSGGYSNVLAKGDHDLTIVDQATNLMWQRDGLDLCSIRKMGRDIEELNKQGYAGFHDWRIPSVEEAMSLMNPAPNSKGLHIHPCFSKNMPFIFVAAKRKPTGYWFVDYKQGKVYWSSGTVPGGFCKLCRSITPG